MKTDHVFHVSYGCRRPPALLDRRADPTSTSSTVERRRSRAARPGAAGAGAPLAGICPAHQLEYSQRRPRRLRRGGERRRGPRTATMNLDSCGGCHAQPSVGRFSSPAVNPQVAFATLNGGARFSSRRFRRAERPGAGSALRRSTPTARRDGGVHALFTITGRLGANGCTLPQPNFATRCVRIGVTSDAEDGRGLRRTLRGVNNGCAFFFTLLQIQTGGGVISGDWRPTGIRTA